MTDSGLPLFDYRPSPPKPVAQDAELRRCVSGIGVHILAFLRERVAVAPQFHLADLNAYVAARAQCAPDSPRRVMGELRRAGWCEVLLLSRPSSLYSVVSVEGGTP